MDRIGAEAFDGIQLRRSGNWAVAFLADWCPFCRAFLPQFEALAGTGPFQLAVADLTDYDTPLWERFEVDVVPTIVVFRGGKPSFRRDGRLGQGLGEADLKALRADLGSV
ncbi:MAG: thioredoxin family protein [Thermoplasmata archaeon]